MGSRGWVLVGDKLDFGGVEIGLVAFILTSRSGMEMMTMINPWMN